MNEMNNLKSYKLFGRNFLTHKTIKLFILVILTNQWYFFSFKKKTQSIQFIAQISNIF